MDNKRIASIALKIAESGTQTPWGLSQSAKSIIRGITVYSTAGHGGICVSPMAARLLSKYTVANGWKWGSGYWYEEDCAANLVLYDLCKNYPNGEAILKRLYPTLTTEKCEAAVRRWYPNYPFEKTEDKFVPPPKVKELKEGDVIYLENGYTYNPIAFKEMNGQDLNCSINNYGTLVRLRLRNYLKDVVKIVRDGNAIWER